MLAVHMPRTFSYKIILILGLILFAASPFFFFLTPELIFQPLLCSSDNHEFFGCAKEIYGASFILSTVAFILGVSLILWALHINSRKKSY